MLHHRDGLVEEEKPPRLRKTLEVRENLGGLIIYIFI
jgi:hypothetical protein